MNSILQRLYSGEICPAIQIVPDNPNYRSINRAISEERNYLLQKLSPEDAERLEKLNDLYHESNNIYCYAGFTDGFKIGVQLICETFCNEITSLPGEE